VTHDFMKQNNSEGFNNLRYYTANWVAI
jgi:hypothetical protein